MNDATGPRPATGSAGAGSSCSARREGRPATGASVALMCPLEDPRGSST